MKLHLKKLFTLHTTSEYVRIRIWNVNVYFSCHPLNVRQGGIERKWRKDKRIQLKDKVLKERKTCEHCGRPLDWNSASIHHIVPKSVDPSREFDINNVMLLCPDCHVRIHRIEQLEAKQLKHVC